jgi:anti-anti-sigma factor
MITQSSINIIKLIGELDIGRREEVRQALQIEGPGPGILVDFVEVSYTDSTIIAEVLRFYNDAHAAERRIAILIGSPRFERILQYAGLSDVFPIFKDRAEALSYLTKEDA